MDSLYKICDMLYKELDNIARDGSLTNDRLNTIEKLTHSIKSIETVLAMKEGGYSNAYENNSYRGRSNAYNSYRGGEYSRRNSRDGGYSNAGDMRGRLNEMLREANDSKEREAIQRALDMM